MMQARAAAAGGGYRRLPLAGVLRRRAATVVDLAVGAAWALAAMLSHAAHDGPLLARIELWAVMCVAMMLPSTAPMIDHVAHNSLSWRRGRAVGGFVAVYLAIWIAFGAIALVLASLAPAPPEAAVLAGALLVAAGWELTALKRRALRACHRSVPLRPRGWRAAASVIELAARNGAACVASCWALMLVMVFAGAAHLLWMVGLTAIVCAQKLLPRQRQSTRVSAGVLAAAAAIVLVVG